MRSSTANGTSPATQRAAKRTITGPLWSPPAQEVLTGKLDAIGFGFLIPVFFVSTGAGLDIDALFHSSRAILLVPVFLAALLVVRGLPALLYVRAVGRAHAVAAGFMQATSLTFIVVATIIGVETIYPPIALHLLKSEDPEPEADGMADLNEPVRRRARAARSPPGQPRRAWPMASDRWARNSIRISCPRLQA